MKTLRRCLPGKGVMTLVLAVLVCRAFGQDSSTVPVVTIQATTSIAYGPDDPGVFTVFRQGNTNETLNVYYTIGGTASNGVDYAKIGNFVEIPGGDESGTIVITPLTDSPPANEAKNVVLQLAPAPTLNPVNYEIGVPSNATVSVTTPGVTFEMPKDGDVFYTPTNIQMMASVNDFEGQAPPTNIEFFAGKTDLGAGTLVPASGPFANIVSLYIRYLTWTNPPPGQYPLTAVATFSNEISATSAPVNITVVQGPQTNLPPAVSLIEPQNGQVFFAPTNILIEAKATDADGSVTNVEFFAGTNDLGPGTPIVLDPPGLSGTPGVYGLVYIFNWQNVPAGTYSLTAVATDNGGASTVSGAVEISVLSTVTNPPVVRIISPANGSIFHAPVDIPLVAYVNYPTDSTASVEFYDGTNDLGQGHPFEPPPVPATDSAQGIVPGPGPIPPIYPTNLFYLVWSNAPVGDHVLTAQAEISFITHPLVLLSKSEPVTISILPPVPPPTNRPAIVSIVATDPVAVEGSNCWVWHGETNTPPTWAAWPTAVCRCFTNTGPKTATFAVHRFGETNDALNVTYDIGGTASNGADYVALPGFVTVPAGESSAFITVVPIDDGPPGVNKTVILSLTPATNTPPDYLIGVPRSAAAIIVDRPGPWPACRMLPGNYFHLSMPGPDAAWFTIEYSTDLTDWTPICTNQVINGSIDFIDPDVSSQAGFYRAVPVANVPGN